MTEGVLSRQRRRATVSLSCPSPTARCEPVERIDRAVELIHQANRAVVGVAVDRDELIALAGLLTQISGALLTLTDQLIAPAHHFDRTRALRQDQTTRPPTTHALLECRNSYLTASTAARAFHAELKR